jgi:hypothetical protein
LKVAETVLLDRLSAAAEGRTSASGPPVKSPAANFVCYHPSKWVLEIYLIEGVSGT